MLPPHHHHHYPHLCPTPSFPVLNILLVKSVPFCLLAKAANRPSGPEAQFSGLEFALFKELHGLRSAREENSPTSLSFPVLWACTRQAWTQG